MCHCKMLVHCFSIMYGAFHFLRYCFWTSVNIKNVSVVSGKSWIPQELTYQIKEELAKRNTLIQILFILSLFLSWCPSKCNMFDSLMLC